MSWHLTIRVPMRIPGQTNFVYVLSHCIVLACGKAKAVKGAIGPRAQAPMTEPTDPPNGHAAA